jgi:hypothetical protein
MKSFSQLNNIVGWTVFAIATIVYSLTAEPTGSLWDCGEFIAAANKLQVVHPPGAPLFLLIGRMFTWVAEMFFPENPEKIAHAVNIMSGVCTAFAVMFVCWATTILGKLTLVGRNGTLDSGQTIAVLGAGLIAGLSSTFATSVWFSAVEGEVYAMSTFFTAMVFWAVLKWYNLPDNKDADRWLIFAAYMAGLSIGVHLLSLLTFPALALFYYFKKYENNITYRGMIVSLIAGTGILVLVQGIVILRLPKIGSAFELFFVNSLGMPYGSGLIFFILALIGLLVYGLHYTHQRIQPNLQKGLVAFAMILVGFSTYGVVFIRANANTPINMNNPSDVFSLVSYLNREQYGDRPLLRGPHYNANPTGTESEDRYGPVNGRYEVIDQKIDYTYDSKDMMFFPRVGHYDKKEYHHEWMKAHGKSITGKPSGADNLRFLFKYQIGWMYMRYFLWNFSGRQNGEQGYYSWVSKSGHAFTGIKMIDQVWTHNQNALPDTMKNHKARNTYYLLPLIFGLFGLFFFARRNRNDFYGTLVLFVMTGLAIIIYSNQPPSEPRERDYVLVGSFMVFTIWIGFGVIALWNIFREKLNLNTNVSAIGAIALVLSAPLIMGFENWDDHNRGEHKGSRDYAINFLESCEKNAIIFTHGDNDTYPLWYVQEVEGIRTDVRVVNLSLLAVDWYIDQLRRKINESPAIKMSIPKEAYRGNKRNSLMYSGRDYIGKYSTIQDVVKWMGEDHPLPLQNGSQTESFIPVKEMVIPVDKAKVIANGTVDTTENIVIQDQIRFSLGEKTSRLIKDEIAILDIIASNNWERPIYFAVTCRPEKTLGLSDYLQLEGMSLRLVPVKTASDGNLGFIGSGRIAAEKTYDNIMNKFKWGNFDKKDLFVDRSYLPSVLSTRLAFFRLTRHYINVGQKDKAGQVLDKYFASYPHMNFPYDYNVMMLINEYYRGGMPEKAKPHVKILANELAQYMNFYQSLNSDDLAAFRYEVQQTQRTIDNVYNVVGQNDEAFKKEIQGILNPYKVQQAPVEGVVPPGQ